MLRERAESVHCFLSQTIGVENIVPEDDVEHALCTLKKNKRGKMFWVSTFEAHTEWETNLESVYKDSEQLRGMFESLGSLAPRREKEKERFF